MQTMSKEDAEALKIGLADEEKKGFKENMFLKK
jgi:hypothetical protein